MKKLALGIVLAGSLLIASQAFSSAPTHSDTITIPENKTIQIMVQTLKGRSKEDVDQYFDELSDDTRILATPDGGFFYSRNNVIEDVVGETIDEDGESTDATLHAKDASTVGEVKQVLYQLTDEKLDT